MLAVRGRYRPRTDASLEAVYQVRLGDDAFDLRVAGGDVAVRRGEAAHPDAEVDVDAATFGDLLYGRETPAAATAAGRLQIRGDTTAVDRLLTSLTDA
jgi:putative sterol carrier protein